MIMMTLSPITKRRRDDSINIQSNILTVSVPCERKLHDVLSKKNKYKKTQQTSDFLLDCDFSDIVQKII
jgi:hypothetical protein